MAFWVSAAVAAPVYAAGANEWQLSLRAGIGVVNVGSDPWGVAGGVDVEYGLTDAWALRASLEGLDPIAVGRQAGGHRGGQRAHGRGAGGDHVHDRRPAPGAVRQSPARRRADRAVPWRAPVTMLASELGVGGDYYLTRQLRAGLSFQYLYRPQDLFQNPRGARKLAVHFLRDCALRVGLLAAAATAPGGAVFFWRCARRARRIGVPSKP